MSTDKRLAAQECIYECVKSRPFHGLVEETLKASSGDACKKLNIVQVAKMVISVCTITYLSILFPSFA